MSQQLNDFLQKIHNKIAMLNEYNTQTYRNHAQYILSWHQIELILQSNVNLSFNCHRRSSRSFYQQILTLDKNNNLKTSIIIEQQCNFF